MSNNYIFKSTGVFNSQLLLKEGTKLGRISPRNKRGIFKEHDGIEEEGGKRRKEVVDWPDDFPVVVVSQTPGSFRHPFTHALGSQAPQREHGRKKARVIL